MLNWSMPPIMPTLPPNTARTFAGSVIFPPTPGGDRVSDTSVPFSTMRSRICIMPPQVW